MAKVVQAREGDGVDEMGKGLTHCTGLLSPRGKPQRQHLAAALRMWNWLHVLSSASSPSQEMICKDTKKSYRIIIPEVGCG